MPMRRWNLPSRRVRLEAALPGHPRLIARQGGRLDLLPWFAAFSEGSSASCMCCQIRPLSPRSWLQLWSN
jgi:hypothetical protein